MCGRFAIFTDFEFVRKYLEAEFPPDLEDIRDNLYPSYNLAPSQKAMVVKVDPETQKRLIVPKQWGLIPSWVKKLEDLKIKPPINAKAEGVATKPMFRAAFKKKRCLVPVDGFFEWKGQGKKKQPYYITKNDEKPYTLAGLWERWEQDETPLETFTIITTDANELVSELHNRMPAIIDEDDHEAWLDPENQDKEALQKLLKPYPSEWMKFRPVSTVVNNVRNNSLKCIQSEAEEQDLFEP